MPLLTPKQKGAAGSLALLAIVVTVVLIGLLWKVSPAKSGQALTVWLANMALLVIFTVVAGYVITGFLRGVLIDSRNKISLSRFQMLLWTVLILSGFLTAVLINLGVGHANPLSIALRPELWALLGISTASLVGSPLIKNNKKNEPTTEQAREQTVSQLHNQGTPPGTLRADGQILSNNDPKNAAWTDMFKGEEVGNAAHLDLGKVQMFFFTLVVWFAYAISLGNQLRKSVNPEGFGGFPDLDEGMVALLGISHAAYLGNKAVPHTPPPQPQPQP